jgi:CBS domain-containing protein
MATQVSQEVPESNKRKEDASSLDEETSKKAKTTAGPPCAPIPLVMSAVPNSTAEISPFVLLLANSKVESIWTRESKIFFAMRNDTVKAVFKGLIQHNFSSCPVLQKTKNKWYGFLDIANIVKFIVQHFEEATLAEQTDIMALLEHTDNFKDLEVADLMKNPMGILTPYHPIYMGYSLFAAYEVMARSNLHRIAIVDANRKLVSVITQSQLVEFTFRNLSLLGAKRSKLVKDMPYNMHEVYHVKPNDIALKAFSVMSEFKVSGIAVLNDDGVLVDQISVRDLKAMAPDGRLFWRLYKPVSDYLQNVKNSRTDAHAAERPHDIITVTPNDTLETVMGLLVHNRIHRVYIVESPGNKKPIGVISLRDVMLEAIPGGHW